MDKDERRRELLDLSKRCLYVKAEDPEKRARINKFVDKIEQTFDLPRLTIESLIKQKKLLMEKG